MSRALRAVRSAALLLAGVAAGSGSDTRRWGCAERGRATEHDTYLVTEGQDDTLMLTLMSGWTEEHLALLERPDVQNLLKPGGEPAIEAPVDPDRDTAASRLACLALRQTEFWGKANFAIEVAHPRFDEAVEAAAAADDEQQALEAARRILEGPEAAEAFGLAP